MTDLLVFQLRRVLRNWQFVLFSVLLPAAFTVFFTQVFGGQAAGGTAQDRADFQRYATDYMVSMMAYGAIGAALGATVRLAFDRHSGWLRQLRVTPVPTARIVGVDIAVGMLLALPSVLVVALVGRFVNGVQLPLGTWVVLVGVMWAGAAPFVALGLLLGLALDEQAAGAAIGILGVVLAALGGLWFPAELFPPVLRSVAHLLPSYWYGELGRGAAADGVPGAGAVLLLAAAAVLFAALAGLVSRRRPLFAVSG
ncbi:ABC transporter permease [Modestobacter sp. I12A-02628]|uniref:Transport permease protein n=1 Tax=Goekera deserti TaxID=2497753 RepID=A0A7K3WB06_9ACTN|nr:ABC transporter permease [Goekera deserti]MPQ97490.1 ABC transporter permease [Goekera deserti]NDI47907.1 ABC transporter permease [Goekera deserti]NEL53655.1 ABC transporter permease [Goekera deserti]